MAKIALRSYLHEIEGLIEKGLTEEAAEHCKYILQTYPKLLAAYRLLGKAYLEKQRFTDAADLFQRVLSSAPDDFVSHVGMSIVREDEGNLDAAIWHMQRAFEVQPYNAAIQGELKRLHGRRDGLEPPKVRLTRGALARMYARGSLYQQAIGELRAALAEDAQRPDLQVLLARMYFLSGMKVESVETCSTLIKKLPYCLEANRILAIILPQTDRKEDSQIYEQRVASLDPYLVYASPEATTSDDVPENRISIEKYDVQLSSLPATKPEQPSWAASLGVSLDNLQPKEDALPDWLTAPVEETAKTGLETLPPGESKPEITGETSQPPIPDWMKAAGWGPSTGSEEVPAPELEGETTGETPEGEIAQGEIPEWLKSMAPAESEESLSPSETGDEGVVLPWEQETETNLPRTIESAETDVSESVESGAAPVVPAIPDWLQDLNNEETVSGEAKLEGDLEQPVAEVPVEEPQKLEIGPAQVLEAVPEEPEAVPAEVPEWLKEIGPESGIEIPAEAAVSPTEEAAALAWLEGLAAKQGAPEEELISKPEDRVEAPPAWVQEQVSEVIMPEGAQVTAGLAPAEEAPEAVTEPILETPGVSEEISPKTVIEQEEVEEIQAVPGEIPGWLKSLGEETAGVETGFFEAQAEELPEIKAVETQPEWLEEISGTASQGMQETLEPQVPEAVLGDEDTGAAWETELATAETELGLSGIEAPSEAVETPESVYEETAPVIEDKVAALESIELPEAEPEGPAGLEEMIEEQPEVAAAEPGLETIGADEGLAWLENLAAKQGVPEEELITPPAEQIETPPEWVQEAVQTEETPEEVGQEASLIDEASAMAWLENLAARQGAPEAELTTKPEERPAATPEWIQEMAAQEIVAEEVVPQEPVRAEATEEEHVPPETVEPFESLTEKKEEPMATAQEVEPELPSWLLETVEEKEEESWTPPETVIEEKPHPLIDINMASLVELESLPGVGFILAQKIIDFREKCGPYARVEDLAGVPGLSIETLNDFKDRITVAKPDAHGPEVVEEIQSQAGAVEDATLIQARNALIQGRLDEMVNAYDLLIKNESMLDDVIRDLREALYRFPMEVSIWQSLGDAYMHNNQLQEALDAYTKAEELLR